MKNGALAAAAKAFCRGIDSLNTGMQYRPVKRWYLWYCQRCCTTGKAGANQRMRLRCEQEDRHLACAYVKMNAILDLLKNLKTGFTKSLEGLSTKKSSEVI